MTDFSNAGRSIRSRWVLPHDLVGTETTLIKRCSPKTQAQADTPLQSHITVSMRRQLQDPPGGAPVCSCFGRRRRRPRRCWRRCCQSRYWSRRSPGSHSPSRRCCYSVPATRQHVTVKLLTLHENTVGAILTLITPSGTPALLV